LKHLKIKDIHGCPHLINMDHVVSYSKEAGGRMQICLIDQRVIKVDTLIDDFEILLVKIGGVIYGRTYDNCKDVWESRTI
jgi:hypothetical protein